jgi:quercetin dioxygenase-like cupin family protein
MSIQYVEPNEIAEVPIGNDIYRSRATTIVKTRNLELIRLDLSTGNEIPTHKAPGKITLQCLEGRVALTAMGETQELTAGHFLFLRESEPHSITAIEKSSLLVTLLSPKNNPPEPFNLVKAASEELFLKSDSPA